VLDERCRRSGNLARGRGLVDDADGKQFRRRPLGPTAAATGTTRTHPEPWRLNT
jgi:hypothetical protein